jgi:hypothetical protein
VTDGRVVTLAIGAALYRWRSAPEPTGWVAGAAVAFGPEAPGPIPCRRRPGFHQPPGLSADVSTGTRPVHCPFFVMWRGGWQAKGRASRVRGRPSSVRDLRRALEWFEAGAAEHRQVRVAREPRVRRRSLAQPERAPLRSDDPGVTATSTEPDTGGIERLAHGSEKGISGLRLSAELSTRVVSETSRASSVGSARMASARAALHPT